MIAVEGKKLDLGDPKSNNEKYAAKEIARYKSEKRRIRVIREHPVQTNAEGNPIKPKKGFKLWGKFANPETKIEEEWMIAIENRTSGDKIFYTPQSQKILLTIDVQSDKNPEFAFFLEKVINLNGLGLRLENLEEEAKVKNQTDRLKIKTDNLILNDLSDQAVRSLAYAWGVGEVEDKGENQLRDDLRTTVAVSEIKGDRGYKGFIEDVDNPEEAVKVRGFLNEAVKKGIIFYNGKTHSAWFKGAESSIVNVPPARWSNKEDYIVDYLITHEEVYDEFMECVRGELQDVTNANLDIDTAVTKAQIVSIAKDKYNIIVKSGNKRVEDIRQEVKDEIAKLTPEEVTD